MTPTPQLVRHLMALRRYGTAGLVGTSTHYVMMWGLLDRYSAPVATTIGAAVGAGVNFLLVRRYAFLTTEAWPPQAVKFGVVALVSLAVNAGVVSVLLGYLPLIANQFLATSTAFAAGYALNWMWTFNHARLPD